MLQAFKNSSQVPKKVRTQYGCLALEDPYYYCPTPANQTSNQPNETETRPGAETTAESVYVANESQSESSASRANSIRESHVFEDEDPESVYIMH